tara:strand:+ start:79 stop:483 length:405 start_codon:yes stop_codon:yes gene_type:complete
VIYLSKGLDLVGDPPLGQIKRMIVYKQVQRNKLNNNQSSQNAISHRELKDFLIKAKKDISSIQTSENNQRKETQEFNDLIKKWTETSQKILLMMSKDQKVLIENKNPKTLMAFGAMGAHINMALQALKATESDQ